MKMMWVKKTKKETKNDDDDDGDNNREKEKIEREAHIPTKVVHMKIEHDKRRVKSCEWMR